MRKLFFALSALAALSLLAPSSGFAQANNQVGLYLDETDLTTVSTTSGPAGLFLQLVISYPYLHESNYGFEGPITQINGIELRLDVPMGESVFAFTPVVNGINVGAIPELILGLASPVDVINNHCHLGFFTCMTSGGTDIPYRLTPIEVGPSLAGDMSFSGVMSATVDELQRMYPTSGSHEAAVFVVNGEPTDFESETWGGVKSLYR